MLRMARLIIFVGLGFYLGYKFSEMQMRASCTNTAGTWDGTMCLNSERPS